MDWFKLLLRRTDGAAPEQRAGLPASTVFAPRIPRYVFDDPQVRIVAVGDLHGRADLLQQLLPKFDKLAADPQRKLIEIYLGDYVDRGSNPQAVIELLVERSRSAAHDVICLAGNHEQMMIAALEDDGEFGRWMDFGGRSTLLSYGVSLKRSGRPLSELRQSFVAALPQAHVEFLSRLGLFHRQGNFFFSHAGIRPGVPLDRQEDEDLLWIRNSFLASSADHGAIIVHGHTPAPEVVFKANRIGIDTGAYRTGNLSGLVVTSDEVGLLDTRRAYPPL